MRSAPLVALVALGCTEGLKNREFQTGSSTTAALARSVYEVNAWDGTVTALDTTTGDVATLEIGGEPTRIARVGDELWVTLRSERSVAVLRASGGDLEEVDRRSTGAEPHGIVATEDGSRVYVAVSQEDQVVEFNGETRKELRRWDVGDDPRWLALHPSNSALFVNYAFDATITRIDLESGKQSEVSPPQTNREVLDEVTFELEVVDLHPRTTGDPSISPMGDVLVVPTLYVDATTPVEQPDETGAPSPSGYGSSGSDGSQLSISRMNAALVAVPLDPEDGSVIERDPSMAIFVGGMGERADIMRGYISSATFDPEGTRVWATLESANAVAIVDLMPAKDQGEERAIQGDQGTSFDMEGVFQQPSSGLFFERNQVFVRTNDNPAGLVFDRDGAPWVQERGDRSLARIDIRPIETVFEDRSRVHTSLRVDDRITVGVSRLGPAIEAGRSLFYSATDSRMVGEGAGVSCSTCHFEGRNDGVTWTFSDGVRNTPSLAGPVAGTGPFTWTQGVESVAAEAQITSEGRMGGNGLPNKDAARIEAFVNWTRDVDVPGRYERSALVDLGAEIFYRAEVGCASCHNGPRYSDNLSHDLFNLEGVNTPGLVNVSATAPYLHDGSVPTLGALLERLRDGSMGSTAGLDDHEMEALEAFLKTL